MPMYDFYTAKASPVEFMKSNIHFQVALITY